MIKRIIDWMNRNTEPSAKTITQEPEDRVAGVSFLINAEGDIIMDVFTSDKDPETATKMMANLMVSTMEGAVLQQCIAVVKTNLKNTGQDYLFDLFVSSLLEYGANKKYQDQTVDRPCAIPSESTP